MRLDVWPCGPCGSSDVRSDFNLRDAAYQGKWHHIAVTFNGELFGSTSVVKGTIMADQSITMATGASLEGRALARVGAVTMDENTIVRP